MFLSTSCCEGQPRIIRQQPPAGFIDEMAANRQLARHAIPKNQNAFDEEVTKSTVKCYHSPARTREQESWKRKKNGRERGSRDRIRTRSAADRAEKNSPPVILPRERYPGSCLSTYYVRESVANWAYLRIGASAAAAFSHVSYTRGRKLTPFFIQRAMCVSRRSLYSRVHGYKDAISSP